jgi:16S rRNA (adenine1518-N6/adenine1519-N6)-dimethyltransferase
MADLLIQIVDKDDNPIGSADMKKAWRDGLWHRVSRVMVQDDSGALLLQLRTSSKELFPDCWDNSAAGHVDDGETYEEAAVRELAEEIGVTNVPLEFLDYYSSDDRYKGSYMREFNKVYLVKIPRDYKIKKQDSEVAEVKWFTKAEVKKLLEEDKKITPGLKNALTRNPFFYEDN